MRAMKLLIAVGVAPIACSLANRGTADTDASIGGASGLGATGGVAGSVVWPDATHDAVGAGGTFGGNAGATSGGGSTNTGGASGMPGDASPDVNADSGTGGTTGWKPPDFSNCVLWLDAFDSGTLKMTGPTVSAWNGKCAGVNATAIANQQPGYLTANGKLVVRCDGVDDRLDITGIPTGASDYTLFFVVTKVFTGPMQRPIWSNRHLQQPVGGTMTYVGFSGSTLLFQNSALPNPALYGKVNYSAMAITAVLEIAIAPNGGREVLLNGTVEAADSVTGGATAVPGGALCADLLTNEAGAYDLHEVVMYNRLLDAGERQIARNALKIKWGL